MSNWGCLAGGGSASPSRVPGSHQRPDLVRSRGIPDVHDPVALVVLPVARREIGGAAAQVDILPSTNQRWWTPREAGPEASNEGNGPRARGIPHVEDLEARGLQARAARLVRDHQEVADQVERVRAHLAVGQVALEDHRGFRGSVTSTAVTFFGGDSWASHRMRRWSRVSWMAMPSPQLPKPFSSSWARSRMLRDGSVVMVLDSSPDGPRCPHGMTGRGMVNLSTCRLQSSQWPGAILMLSVVLAGAHGRDRRARPAPLGRT